MILHERVDIYEFRMGAKNPPRPPLLKGGWGDLTWNKGHMYRGGWIAGGHESQIIQFAHNIAVGFQKPSREFIVQIINGIGEGGCEVLKYYRKFEWVQGLGLGLTNLMLSSRGPDNFFQPLSPTMPSDQGLIFLKELHDSLRPYPYLLVVRLNTIRVYDYPPVLALPPTSVFIARR